MSKTKVPAIPAPTDANLRDVARAIKGVLDVREGVLGDPLDANVTFRDLSDGGIIKVTTINRGGGSGSLVVSPGTGGGDGYDPASDLTPPPAPTNFSATAGLATIILEWDSPTYTNHAYTEVWRSPNNVIGNAERVGTSLTQFYTDSIGQTGVTFHYWVRFMSQADVAGPYNSANSTVATTGKIGNVDLGPLIVEAGNLASGAVTATKLAAQAVDLTKFANGIEPITVVTGALPTTKSTSSIFRTDDGKLYRWNGTAYVASVPAVDVSGQLTNAQLQDIAAAKITGTLVASQIADATLTTAKFASNIEPLTIVTGALPTTKSTNTIFRTDDSKTYRWNGTAYVATVPAADIAGQITDAQVAGLAASKVTGQLTNSQIEDVAAAKLTGQVVASQIADASLTTAKFAAGIEPVTVVTGALPGTKSTNTIFRMDDGKTYRWNGSSYVATVPAGDVSGQIVGTQITDGAIATAKLAANAVTAAKIAANTITANEIAAGTITAGQIAAGAIGASQIAAGAITTEKLLVASRGVALNDDPAFTDPSAWPENAGFSFVTITDGVSGTTAARSASSTSEIRARAIAINPTKTYRVRARVNPRTGNGVMYLTVGLRDAAGNMISRDGTHWYYPVAAVTPSAGWNEYSGSFGAGQGGNAFPANARTMYVGIYLNYGGTTGYMEVQDLRLEEYVGADLIVDGAISAAKIAAGAVTTAKLDAGSITADKMSANAISAGAIQAGAVTTAKIAAGAVTANEIAAATITGGKIAAGTITGSNIAADTITAGQIAAGAIGASEVAAGAIRANHILVAPKGLNPDPLFEAGASFWGGFVEQRASSDGVVPAGCPGRLATKFNSRDNMGPWIDVNPGEVYKVSLWVNREGATAGAGWVSYSVNGLGQDQLIYHAGQTSSSGWQQVVTTFSVSANVRRMRFGVWINYDGSGSQFIWATDFQVEKVNDASLIVDGAVTAVKVAAGSISTEKLAAGAVTADTIAANAITTPKIATDAITSDKIAANAVTADEIAANAITTGKIAAGAVSAAQIAAGAVTTGKLLVTGQGKAINPDPTFQDPSAWTCDAGSITFTTDPNAPAPTGANRILRATEATRFYATPTSIEGGRQYKVSVWARKPAGTGLFYFRLYCFDSAGNLVSYVVTALTPALGTFEGVTIAGGWIKYTGHITPAASTTSGRLIIHANWDGGGYTDFADLRCEEYIGADLIVDGAIVANKLAANAIAVGTAAIQNGAIVNAMLGNAVIDSAKIADAAIVEAKIGFGAITNAKISGTIQSDNYSAGSAGWAISKSNGFAEFGAASIRGQLTASQINSNGLTIRDLSGNILFGVSNNLDFSRVGGATRPADNATVGAVAGSNLRDSNGRTIGDAKFLGNLLDTSKWVPGTIGSQPGFGENGTSSGGVNYIDYDGLPDGRKGPLWRARSGSAAGSDAEGGWNGELFAIDHTKMYRFSVWIRCFGGNASGSFYLGTSNVAYVAGANEDNPYFVSAARNLLPDSQWVLVVGYVFPSGYSGAQEYRGGVYRASDGVKFLNGTDYRWRPGAIWTYHRTYQYYTNQANNYQDFYDPRVELMDGSEPSLDALLAGGKAYAASLTSTWSGVSSRPANLSGLSGSEAIQNSQIFISSNAIQGIGSGAGTVVANTAISVDTSTGAIVGIGTGNGESVANNVNSRIMAPSGGIFTSGSSGMSGSIRIRLPARLNIDYPMVKFTVEIYEYIAGYSATLSISGHTSGTTWYNVSAQLLGGSNVEYPVYFGHDGTYFVVWIGNASETWEYPQVFVRDVLVGYTSVQASLWASNWAISLDTGGPANVSRTVLDTYPAADWSKTARRPANLSTLSGSEAIQNSQISVSGGAISGIGTGNGTAVANNAITVDGGGAIQGIGSGAGTAVANSLLAPKSFYVGGSQTTFYPVRIRSSVSGGAVLYDFVISRPDVHSDSTWLGSYSCSIRARAHSWGNAPGTIEKVDQRTGNGNYNWGVAAVNPTWGDNSVWVWVRGGMTHVISMNQPVASFSVDVYTGGFSDGYSSISARTDAPYEAYLNKSYSPDMPKDWGASITGAGKPQDNANNTFVDVVGRIQGVSAGSGTAVSNNAITVSGGVLTGIGTSNVQVDNSFQTIGQNLIPNSDWTQSITMVMGWNPNGATWFQTLAYASIIGGWEGSYILGGTTTRNVFVHQQGPTAGGDNAVAVDLYPTGDYLGRRIPVVVGQRYCMSAYLQGHRCHGGVGVQFFNAAGALISTNESGPVTLPYGQAAALSQYLRVFVMGTAPADAASAALFIRKYNTWSAENNSYFWVAAPQFENVSANAPGPSPYMAGPASNANQLLSGGSISSSNVSSYIANDTIGIAQLGTDIQTTNYVAGSSGWRITKAGAAYFNNVSVRGEINGGSYNGWGWPASGLTGFHLGPNGLLLGNGNDGKYFLVYSDGNIYAPGLTIINGTATFSGTVSANVINTEAIVGGAAAAASSATSTGASASVTVTVPANASALLIEYYLGPPTYTPGASGDKYGIGGTADIYGPVLTGLTANGGTIGSITVAPAAGTYTITASRSYYTGTMRLGVIVLKR